MFCNRDIVSFSTQTPVRRKGQQHYGEQEAQKLEVVIVWAEHFRDELCQRGRHQSTTWMVVSCVRIANLYNTPLWDRRRVVDDRRICSTQSLTVSWPLSPRTLTPSPETLAEASAAPNNRLVYTHNHVIVGGSPHGPHRQS